MTDFWKFVRHASALVAIMGICVAAGWALGNTVFGMENRLTERIARLEAKVLDVKEDDESSTNDVETASEGAAGDRIYIGDTVQGRLDEDDAKLLDGSYFEDWVLEIAALVTVTVEMTSNSLDPFLFLSRGERGQTGDFEALTADDDGGDGLNARLSYELEPGVYTITANAYGEDTGRYTLSVVSDLDQ